MNIELLALDLINYVQTIQDKSNLIRVNLFPQPLSKTNVIINPFVIEYHPIPAPNQTVRAVVAFTSYPAHSFPRIIFAPNGIPYCPSSMMGCLSPFVGFDQNQYAVISSFPRSLNNQLSGVDFRIANTLSILETTFKFKPCLTCLRDSIQPAASGGSLPVQKVITQGTSPQVDRQWFSTVAEGLHRTRGVLEDGNEILRLLLTLVKVLGFIV